MYIFSKTCEFSRDPYGNAIIFSQSSLGKLFSKKAFSHVEVLFIYFEIKF